MEVTTLGTIWLLISSKVKYGERFSAPSSSTSTLQQMSPKLTTFGMMQRIRYYYYYYYYNTTIFDAYKLAKYYNLYPLIASFEINCSLFLV